MTYEEAMSWLDESKTRGILPGLSRISHLLAILGNPQDGLRILHVAGTNGKGSTCAFLESMLRASGQRTGLFTSPWLLEPSEMFQINGQSVSRAEFAKLVSQVAEAAAEMAGQPGLPTEYECYAAMAFLLFRQRGCTAVVLETCMGGRFDTTNAYSGGNLAILVKISLDHMQFLGQTLGEIAWHKAGILRANCPVISWQQEREAADVVEAAVREAHASLTILRPDAVRVGRIDEKGTTFTLDGLGVFHTRLPGLHQAMNAALAVLAFQVFCQADADTLGGSWRMSPVQSTDSAFHMDHADKEEPSARMMNAMRDGIEQAQWPCRFEILPGFPPVLVDSAHNPDGIRSFVDTFQLVYPGRKVTLIFGAMRDKDVAGMLSLLAPIVRKLILVKPETPRAMPLDELYDIAVRTCCMVEKRDTMEKALETGFAETTPDDVLAAVGSIFYIGRLKEIVLSSRNRLA